MSDENQQTGDFVRAARERLGLSQEETAQLVREQIGGEYAKFHRNSVSNIERGLKVEDGTVSAVLKVLGMPPLVKGVLDPRIIRVREVLTAWLMAIPEDRLDQVEMWLVNFMQSHPQGNARGARGGGEDSEPRSLYTPAAV
jgi:transcriptional regulator with XRE-family HTH domain